MKWPGDVTHPDHKGPQNGIRVLARAGWGCVPGLSPGAPDINFTAACFWVTAAFMGAGAGVRDLCEIKIKILIFPRVFFNVAKLLLALISICWVFHEEEIQILIWLNCWVKMGFKKPPIFYLFCLHLTYDWYYFLVLPRFTHHWRSPYISLGTS